MKHNDKLVITRTSTVKDPATHIVKPVTETFPSTGFYSCRLGRANGSLVQMSPQGTFIQQLKLYVPDVNANVKAGDIATINGTTRYIVSNPYKPNNHHIEADVTYKEEV
ncbi:hypothetical protein [Clostridium sp. JN-9]|uniref:hypothetical protein n=1 Tax=Clostridium sp. JN-9 TaxID=2507159 RepID=UPI000FFE02BF|nr:hypothetical protein [Clostridium sp. JN-9]QAT40839.1 hypothetical protein EQM05_11515 [Clostridium sp. JN-9]